MSRRSKWYKANSKPFQLPPGVVSGVGDRLDVLVLRVGLDLPVHGEDLWLGLGLHPSQIHGWRRTTKVNEEASS